MASDVANRNRPRILAAAVAAAAAGGGGGTAAGAAEGWNELGKADLAALGIASCVDVAIALVAVHVAFNHAWPPYRAVIPELVVYTGLAVSRWSVFKN